MRRFIEPPDEILIRVGRFAVSWSGLDHALEATVWELARTRPAVGKVLTETATTGELTRLIEKRLRGVGGERKDRIVAAIKEVKAALPTRNMLFHGVVLFDQVTGNLAITRSRKITAGDLIEPEQLPLADLLLAERQAHTAFKLLMIQRE